jgi:hypothetical protein
MRTATPSVGMSPKPCRGSRGGYVPPCDHRLPDRTGDPRRTHTRAAHRGRPGKVKTSPPAGLAVLDGFPAPERQAGSHLRRAAWAARRQPAVEPELYRLLAAFDMKQQHRSAAGHRGRQEIAVR